MKNKKLVNLLIIAGLSSFLLSSCETLDLHNMPGLKKIPNYVISINEIVKYPRGTPGEKEIESFDGRSIWVRKHYEFSSKSIKEIEAVPIPDNPGYFKIKLEMDDHGALIAMRLCNDISHAPWAMLVNGTFYRTVEFNKANLNHEYSEIILEGPFEKTVADYLVEYSVDNYDHYNPHD